MVDLADVPTPALVLDLERLDTNIARMADRCWSLGVSLRPHLKTHKCVEIAERQRKAGARGVTVSTLQEAKVFADHGFHDITWAFPVILSRLDEARHLAQRVRLSVTIDSVGAFDALEKAGDPFHVWLKIDCGYHRAGMDPRALETVALARRLAASRILKFDGLLTHSGHAYHGGSRGEIKRVAEQERRAVADLREKLAAEEIKVEASVGSTPAMSVVESLDGVTEARPGNYVFYDAMQVALGSCQVSDCAVTVLASVVSSQPGAKHCVVDAGALALSKDTGLGGETGMGAIHADYEKGTLRRDAKVSGVSQEHGVVSAHLPVGERVRILPNHSCLTAACFDEYHVVRGTEVVDRWKIWRAR
jgi:D-serine deaminase-like pyridoxal phosphate-dependent protein